MAEKWDLVDPNHYPYGKRRWTELTSTEQSDYRILVALWEMPDATVSMIQNFWTEHDIDLSHSQITRSLHRLQRMRLTRNA